MVATEKYIGQPVLRKEDPDLLTGQARYIDNFSVPGMAWMAMVRPPYVHATIGSIDTAAAAAMPGVIGVFTGEDLGMGALPFVWPVTEDIKVPVHYPLATDKIRFAGDAVAVVLAETREQAEDAAEAVVVQATALPALTDMREAMKDETLIHDDLGTNVVVHWVHGGGGDQSVFDSAPVIVEETYDQPRLIPNPMEPRGLPGLRRARDGRVDARHRDPDPAHREGHALWRRGDRRVEVPRDRPRRGRRVRLEAERLRRGGHRPRAREALRPPGEVDREPRGELRRHDPRPRRLARLHPGRHRGRQDPGDEVRRDRRHGRVLPAAHARDPRARRLGLHGAVRPTGLLVRVPRHRHELHAHRRLPRRGPARGHLRGGAARRRVRPTDRQGPGRGAPDELPPAVRGGRDVDHGAERRQRELRAAARQGARAERVRRAPQGTAGSPRPRRHEAARDRAQHLHRDVRPGALEHPGRAALRGGRLGRRRRSSACRAAR